MFQFSRENGKVTCIIISDTGVNMNVFCSRLLNLLDKSFHSVNFYYKKFEDISILLHHESLSSEIYLISSSNS